MQILEFNTTFFLPIPLKRVNSKADAKSQISKLIESLDRDARAGNGKEGCGLRWVPEKLSDVLSKSHQPDHSLWQTHDEELTGTYSERVYFHPFVQKFLFPTSCTSSPTTREGDHAIEHRMYRCDDLAEIELRVPPVGSNSDKEMPSFCAEVRSLRLHVFDLGLAFLAVELGASAKDETGITPETALRINDSFRRIFPPYFVDGAPQQVFGQYRWKYRGQEDASAPFQDNFPHGGGYAKQTLSRVDGNGEQLSPSIARYWFDLLPNAMRGRRPVEMCVPPNSESRDLPGLDPKFAILADDRAPITTAVRVSEEFYECDLAQSLNLGHFMDRLANVDEYPWDGNLSKPAYDPGFLDEAREDQQYRRFASMGTLYQMTDFSFAGMIGDKGDSVLPGVLMSHNRRHYRQMGLLAYFQKYYLVALSSWLSNTSAGNERDYRTLQDEMYRFRHHAWFTGISGQQQPTELYAKWRKHLGLQELFEEVKDEIDGHHDLIADRLELRQTQASEALNLILAFLGAIGLAAGIVATPFFQDNYGQSLNSFVLLSGGLMAALGLLMMGSRVNSWFKTGYFRPFGRWLCVSLLGGILAFFHQPVAEWSAARLADITPSEKKLANNSPSDDKVTEAKLEGHLLVQLHFFLGGQDLEMVEIGNLLRSTQDRLRKLSGLSEKNVSSGPELDISSPELDILVTDEGLSWGASVTDYAQEFNLALTNGHLVVPIELTGADDLARAHPNQVFVIDHHNARAGKDQPTALEQVHALLSLEPRTAVELSDLAASSLERVTSTLRQLTPPPLTRWQHLVSANDRAHIDGMLALSASHDELVKVRAADRAAQGVTPADERAAEQSLSKMNRCDNGLALVNLTGSTKTSPVTDRIDRRLGGEGSDYLLIVCRNSAIDRENGEENGGAVTELGAFGPGAFINLLRSMHPDCWYGGNLPTAGFWGCAISAEDRDAQHRATQLIQKLCEVTLR